MGNQENLLDNKVNYLSIFTKKRYLLLTIIVTGMTAAASMYFERNRGPMYTATATLIVDFQDPINTSNSRSMLPALLQEEYMATQIGIISSQYMAEKVISNLDFENNRLLKPIRDLFLQQEDINEDNINNRLNRWALSNLRVYVHNKSTRLIKIAFNSSNQDRSVKLADTFAEYYLDTVLELNQAPIKSSASWIEESGKPILEALDKAEDKLSSRPSSSEINEVYMLLDTAQNNLNILTSMINESRIDGVSQRDNQYLQKLNTDILENEVLLIDISREHGRLHPEYLGVEEKLDLLKERLGQAVSQQISSMKTTMSSLNQTLVLRGSVSLTNVTLLNFSAVDIVSDETGEQKALIYGAAMGLMLGILLAFLSFQIGFSRNSSTISNAEPEE